MGSVSRECFRDMWGLDFKKYYKGRLRIDEKWVCGMRERGS